MKSTFISWMLADGESESGERKEEQKEDGKLGEKKHSRFSAFVECIYCFFLFHVCRESHAINFSTPAHNQQACRQTLLMGADTLSLLTQVPSGS